jgi:pilus assembly protein FimV
MSSNEEYLDSLLKSMMPSEEGEPQGEETQLEAGVKDQPKDNEKGEIDDFSLDSLELPEELKDFGQETDAPEETTSQADGETESLGDMSMDDIDAMLASLDGDTSLEDTSPLDVPDNSKATETADVKPASDEKEEAGQDISVDDDMLAMLESVPDESTETENDGADFDFFSGEEGFDDEMDTQEEPESADDTYHDLSGISLDAQQDENESSWNGIEENQGETAGEEPQEPGEESTSGKKEKKKLKLFQGRKKKKEKKQEESEDASAKEQTENDSVSGLSDDDMLDSILQSADETQEQDEKEPKEKSEGFWKRMLEFLMAEDEDEEQEQPSESDDLELPIGNPTEENLALLDELSAEDNKKGKEKKKNKKSKKKGKEAAVETEDGEEGEEAPVKAKKAKKSKKKKKEPVLEEAAAEPEKKLSRKKVIPIFVFCATIAAVIILGNAFIPAYRQKKEARIAYDQQRYEETYDLLYGKQLNEEDESIFQKSSIILQVRHILESYQVYRKLDMNLEALDTLLEGVGERVSMLQKAEQYHVTNEVDEEYQQILETLYQDYGISGEEAEEILSSENNLIYTKKLMAIVNGVQYDPQTGEESTEKQDVLPEEEEILEEMQTPEETAPVDGQEL